MMRKELVVLSVGIALLCLLNAPVYGAALEDLLAQVDLPGYMSYIQPLTGVTPLPLDPPVTIRGRNSYREDAFLAGSWIAQEFESYGLATTTQSFAPDMAPNVIAELPGTTRPEDIYILCAHYDSYAAINQAFAAGCDDNASGTSAVMLAAEIMSQYEFEGTIRFIAFSGEEQGLLGSFAYASQAAAAGENIAAVLNLDMILHPSFDNMEPDPDHDLDLEYPPPFAALGEYLAGQFAAHTTIDVQTHEVWFGASDHVPFGLYGFPAVGGAENTLEEIYGGSNDSYHQIFDRATDPDYEWDFAVEVTRGSMAGVAGLAGLVPEPGALFTLALVGTFGLRRRGA
jgi:hypothetical protein